MEAPPVMTAIIHLFWAVTTSHGTAGAVLGSLVLCGAADVVTTVAGWLRTLAATLAREIRPDRGHAAGVIPLDHGEDEARAAAGNPARDRD
jgi:hypothetical protein